MAVVCASVAGGGGVAAVARRHAHELAREFRVLLVARDVAAGLTPTGVEGVPVRSAELAWARRFGHAPRTAWFAARAIAELAGRHATDPLAAVICEGHVEAAAAVRTLGHRNVPTILVCHGDVFARPRGTYDPILTALYKAATPIAYQECGAVVVLSPAMRDWALRGGAILDRIIQIPNGIAPEDIGLPAHAEADGLGGVSSGRTEVLFVGRLAPEKGVSDLVAACGELKRDGRVEFRLSIAGDGPLRFALEGQAWALGLANDVTFLGLEKREELGWRYTSAHIVCVPSHSDPQPGVVLEAMVSGCAIVGTRVDGIPSMIEHGVHGVLVPPKEPLALARALSTLALDRDLRTRLGQSARRRAQEEFGWEACGNRLRALVRRMAGVSAGTRLE